MHKLLQDITRQSSVSTLGKSKKKLLLASLDELAQRMPSLLDIDHPCAQRHIADARHLVEVDFTLLFAAKSFLLHFLFHVFSYYKRVENFAK